MDDIANNLTEIKKRIALYEERYQRARGSVSLLAASKKQPLEKIVAAVQAGQRCFGESYLQEALPKMAALSSYPIEWHFIGPIQSNKTRKIAEYFSWVHSVADIKIAKRLNDQRPSHLPPLNICLEVNVSQEISKSGVPPQQILTLIEECAQLPNLSLRGLMAIPAPAPTLAQQRQVFHQLFLLYQRLRSPFHLNTLSMGMSDDFEAAIAEGATIIRIGTAIFGERTK